MSWDEQRMSFGAVAAVYERYRPDWPAATAAWLTGIEDGGPLAERAGAGGLDVLDLGAGTGKLTRTLVAAGHRVTAVDPSEGMLEQLSGALSQVRTLIGTGEQIPAPNGSFDAVTVAQAWHWMDQPVAAAECARVLRPGGLLALAWHGRAKSVTWVGELDELAQAPAPRPGASVRSGWHELQLPAEFGEMEAAEFDYEQRLTPAGLAAQVSSWSYVAANPERERILAEVEALGQRVADAEGLVTLPFLTYCYRAVRLDR